MPNKRLVNVAVRALNIVANKLDTVVVASVLVPFTVNSPVLVEDPVVRSDTVVLASVAKPEAVKLTTLVVANTADDVEVRSP